MGGPTAQMGRDGIDWCMCCPARKGVLVIRFDIMQARLCLACVRLLNAQTAYFLADPGYTPKGGE